MSACALTPGDTCGTNMHFESALGVCVCNDDAIVDGGGCRACAADEVVVAGACACPADQAKDADGICAAVPGLGTPCSETAPCSNAVYPHCSDYRGGTCTKTCATDNDCPATYTCADWEPTPYCRPFTGFASTCVAPADCTSFDANVCMQGHCAVQGCTVGRDDCPRDTKCCDFSNFGVGTLCAPMEYCP